MPKPYDVELHQFEGGWYTRKQLAVKFGVSYHKVTTLLVRFGTAEKVLAWLNRDRTPKSRYIPTPYLKSELEPTEFELPTQSQSDIRAAKRDWYTSSKAYCDNREDDAIRALEEGN